VQPDVRTVQGELEAGLRSLGIEGRVSGAGRTDAGVHATGQEMSFDAPRHWITEELARALESVLPADVWIETLREAAPGFHPRFQATGRRYEYYLAPGLTGRSPHRRRGTSWIAEPPDLEALREVGRTILGRHDFDGLSKSGQPDVATVCTIEEAEWLETPLGDLRFTVVADRFLHRMVRYMVAAMVDVGAGKRPLDDMGRLLAGADEVRPPSPAAACGLYLTGVRYREGWNRPAGVPGLWSVPHAGSSAPTGT